MRANSEGRLTMDTDEQEEMEEGEMKESLVDKMLISPEEARGKEEGLEEGEVEDTHTEGLDDGDEEDEVEAEGGKSNNKGGEDPRGGSRTQLLASSSKDKTIRIWNVATGKSWAVLHLPKGHMERDGGQGSGRRGQQQALWVAIDWNPTSLHQLLSSTFK